MANFNIVVDEDQQWLLNCLSATLDPNHEVRSFAEASLNQASLQPGFGSALSKVAANRELPLGLRQISFFIIMGLGSCLFISAIVFFALFFVFIVLFFYKENVKQMRAAVLLKQFIKKHWHEAEEAFEHPAVSSDEKAVVRRLLLLSLDDSHRKICTAISMAVASIAAYDWPEVWPDLLPYLMKLINDQTNMNGVHGALRCLALLSVDLDDTVVPTLVPALFPCLLKIVSSPEMYDKYLRTKALSIVYSCISMLGVMSGVYKTETSALIVPMVKPWMDQFSKILNHPLQSEDPDDWSIRTEVLKCLNQFVQNFPSLIESEFMIIVGPLWQTFMTSLGVYVRSSIEGTEDPFDGRYDSDGAEKSLDSFVVQLFEFLLTIVGSAKLVKVIMNNVEELTYYTIAFLQITEQQVHTWSMDANQFVADEDDVTYSCRVSGALLLEEVVNSCGTEGISAIIVAAKKRFSESQREKDAGSPIWWRIREATLFALASLSEQLLEAEDSELTRVGSGNLLEQIITEDIGLDVHQYPFLYSRIFSSVAKFSSVISHGVLEHFLYAAIKAISMDVPPPVKVGACRALSELLPETNKVIIHPHLMSLFQSLSDLLNQASDETLHLVLETLQEAIKAGYELSASIEPIISPVVLNMWASHISDPFICIDAIEVMETLKNAPGCIRPLVSRVLPYVWSVLNKPQQQPDGLVAGSVDLVTMLLKNAPIDVVKTVYDACFDTVIQIVLQSDDHSEMQNATECLAAFVSGGRQDVLAWSGDLENTMRRLLDAASRLLDPDLDSSGSLFVGSYILQLILHLPSQMAPHIRDLVAALIRRMQSAQIAGLRSSLLLIFARLVHLSAPKVEQFIDLLVTIPAEGYDNSFVYLMSEWTQQQGEIQGAYQIKVTTTALALLLSSRHAELAKINVQGYLFQSAAGITTRSKAKLTPDQWTVVPLPAKIMALLADALVEIQEQVVAGDNQDSDWEEVEADNVELDKDLMYSAGVTSSGRPSHLEAIAKAFNKINLANYLAEFFVNFSQSERQMFDHIFQSLTQDQRNAIQMVRAL
ncbi:importin-9 isoform X1 [Prunus yedoensis var. nudiflora]|uniref:Importin-9 isoform X1 n=1 Tax=Prunus yedoensis var. nudiflora TaxID=2094558 RepID=A0A314Z259_PRUYE|nr:importin-9 isoform X1 [Prunus yedoensis var. nudiflora]